MIDLQDLLAHGCKARNTVGIGVPEPLLFSTQEALRKNGCEVKLVGFGGSKELAKALHEGEIDAAVRGTLGSSAVMADLRSVFSLKEIMRVALLGDPAGKPLLLAPVGIDEGKDMLARLELVRSALVYLSPLGWSPSIGVLSKGRAEDADRGEEIRASIADGEKIVQKLRGDGLDAAHHSILVEEAAKTCDMIVAPDGISGNLMFRALHFLGGWKAYGAPVVNLTKVFVDTSRAKADFTDSVLLAAGLAEARRVRRFGP